MTESAPTEDLGMMLGVEAGDGGVYNASLESFWGHAEAADLLARAVRAALHDRGATLRGAHVSLVRVPRPDEGVQLIRQDLGPDRSFVAARASDSSAADILVRVDPSAPGESAGLTYQGAHPGAGLPSPEELPSEKELAESEGWAQYAVGPVESRRIGGWREPVKDDETAEWIGWLRPRAELASDPALQGAALAFLSQYRSHWALERRLGDRFPSAQLSMVDHALWVHRTPSWNDWLLVRTRSAVGVAGRCLSEREIFTRDGQLMATAHWETVVS